jgi:nucleotide-binding universal stress UspA family protein
MGLANACESAPMKILLASDGSEFSRHAARYLARFYGELSEPAEIHILTVHAPLPYPGAAGALPAGAKEKYQREESEKALAVAEGELKAAGIQFRSTWRVGTDVDEIVSYAASAGIELIVMGSHGHGALVNLALGSVATGVLKETKIPMLIVRG